MLVVTNMLPGERRSGGEIVTQSVVDALCSAGHEVRVLGYRAPDDTAADSRGEICVGRRRIETRAAGLSAAGWMLRAVATRGPYTGAKWVSRGYRRAVAAGLAERPAALVVDHAGIYSVVPPAARLDVPMVFVGHNAEARMYEQLAAASGSRAGRLVYRREARRIGVYEAELVRHARQVWALTAADADYFRSLHPSADVRTLEVASVLPEPAARPEPEYDVAIIGTWSWHANAHGLEWFAEEVLPRLNGLTVEVAGRGADWLAGRSPKVRVRGVVADAADFMARARVVAVPSVEGGGVQLKTLDGIACGVPLVSTTVGTRGLDGLPGSVAVADDPAEFARQLERFAADPDRGRLRAEAVAWSRARRERLERDVADWVAELA
jgi:glycosyltransferase involved in cell wall biosynthesis